MYIYGIMLAIVFFIYAVYYQQYGKEIADRRTITIFFILYILLLSFRDASIGNDTRNYIRAFETIRNVPFKELYQYFTVEPGFVVFEKVVGLVGGERFFLVVCALVMVLPILRLYKEEGEGAFIEITLFLNTLVFDFFFSGLRQGIAISLSVPAFYMAKKKKIIPFILIVLLAFTFHRTGLLLALIYPIYHARITKRWLWVVIPLFIITYMNRGDILTRLINLSGEEYQVKYEYLMGMSGQLGLTILFVLLSIYSYFIMDESIADDEDIGLRNILLLATYIHLFTPLHPTISRINYYFIIFIPVAISRINNRYNERYVQIRNCAVVFLPIFLLFHFFIWKSDSLNVLNYKFFF